ncbi:tyrosine-type recombinase/integrase [Ferrimicrobium sp.]|uniref:site-specific integrase n=1 Tax=Ferrimicrobium sp. TaxID=2926050 RepID=UPI0026157AD6|nr:tyrosine-type recombinase/integrase [Ferrimicrobium sp.]
MTASSPYRRSRSAGDGTITKSKPGTYRAELRWTDASGAKRRWTKTTRSLREANKALTEFKRLRDSGDEPRAKTKTLGGLLDAWVEFKASEVSVGTIDQYRYALRHIKAGLGGAELSKLQPQAIDEFLRSKLGELSPRYVKLLRTVLSMSLDQAVRWQLLASNPAKLSASIKQSQVRGRSLTPDQAKALLRATQGDRLRGLWVLMLATGLRRGEAIALEWRDYDTQAHTLRIERNRKKSGSAVIVGDLKTERSRRTLPLSEFVVQELEAHRLTQLAEREHLASLGVQWREPAAMFTTAWGQWLDPDNISKAFKRLAEKAGLGAWHLHELRHSAASLLLAQGVRLEEVSELVGHASIRVTADVYGHLQPERLRAATEALGGYLSGLDDE